MRVRWLPRIDLRGSLSALAAFLFPGLPQLLAGRVRPRICLVFLVGTSALVNLGTALLFIGKSNVASFDPISVVGYVSLFGFFPGGVADANPDPDGFTVVAQVTPKSISFQRLVSIQDPESLFLLQPHFWAYFALFVLIYLGCGAASAWDSSRERRGRP